MTETPDLFYKRLPDSPVAEKKAAAELLETLEGHWPDESTKGDIEGLLIMSPAIQIARASLRQIRDNGGRLDPSIIGLLSNAGNLADIISDAKHEKNKPGFDKDNTSYDVLADLLGVYAEKIMLSGLVELPVISRSRGMKR